MGCSEDFSKPAWGNSIDTDLDAMRDSLTFLLTTHSKSGRYVFPGWNTVVTSAGGNYASPDSVTLSRGTRKIKVTFTYDSVTGLNDTLQYSYFDGLTDWVDLDLIHLFYVDGVFQRTYDELAPLLFEDWWDVETSGIGINWAFGIDLLDEGVNYCNAEWSNDVGNDTDIIGVYNALISADVPATAQIYWVTVEISAMATGTESPILVTPLYLKNVRIAGWDTGTSAFVYGNSMPQTAVSTIQTVYTFEGDLSFWGLTNAQMLTLFDESGDGWVEIAGYCDDTSLIPSPGDLTLAVDYIKIGLSYR